MLQQTQAERIVRAYPRFLERFPTLRSLADADAADVLRAWGSLGYNRRAIHLWRAARACVERGGVPARVAELEALPGVGPYTARAVASFAFGADEAPVEANIRRILTRVFGLPSDADVQELADDLLPAGRSAGWNQALMDLGSMVCRPRRPRCDGCPLAEDCSWRAGVRPEPRRRAGRRVPFHETSRYARGRLVDALRSAPDGLTVQRLRRETGLGTERLDDALGGLERDGVVSRRGRRVVLGPTDVSGRDRGAPRRR